MLLFKPHPNHLCHSRCFLVLAFLQPSKVKHLQWHHWLGCDQSYNHFKVSDVAKHSSSSCKSCFCCHLALYIFTLLQWCNTAWYHTVAMLGVLGVVSRARQMHILNLARLSCVFNLWGDATIWQVYFSDFYLRNIIRISRLLTSGGMYMYPSTGFKYNFECRTINCNYTVVFTTFTSLVKVIFPPLLLTTHCLTNNTNTICNPVTNWPSEWRHNVKTSHKD